MGKVMQFIEAVILITMLIPILLILYPIYYINEKVFG